MHIHGGRKTELQMRDMLGIANVFDIFKSPFFEIQRKESLVLYIIKS